MALLLTVDEYKEFERINSTENDDKLTKIATSVSALVRSYCGSEITTNYSTVKTEYFDIQWDTYVVQLNDSPVIDNNNLKVYERGAQDVAYTQLYRDGQGSPASYDWYFDTVTDSVMRTGSSGAYAYFPKGVKSVKVEYNAGYATTPEDLKLALVDLITYYDKKEHKSRFTLGAAVVQNRSANAEVAERGFPDHIRRILDMYKI